MMSIISIADILLLLFVIYLLITVDIVISAYSRMFSARLQSFILVREHDLRYRQNSQV